ncbi:MAG: DMT family transporter [Betaproteobacteria bacterium]
MPVPSSRTLAWGALVLTAALWASSAVTARGLLDTLAPAWLAVLRWVVVLAALVPFVWRERAAIAHALAHDKRSLAVFAAVGFAPQTYLVYLGLVGTSAINLGLLNSAIPVLIVAIAALLHHRRPQPLESAGLALSLAGVAIIVARGQWSTIASLSVNGHDLVILVGMGVWAYYTVRLARRDDGLSFPAFMFAGGLLGLAMVVPAFVAEALLHRVVMPTRSEWAGVLYLGVLPTLVAMLLFAYGIRRVGPVQAGLFTHLVPVFAALLATLFLGETLHAFHAAGFALVAGGAILGCLKPETAAADAELAVAATVAGEPRG